MKLVVYQLLGQLTSYEEVTFEIHGKRHEHLRFSSFAISKHLLEEERTCEALVKLIVPISVEQPSVLDGESLDLKLLQESVTNRLKDIIGESVELSRVSWNVMLIPAIGTYDFSSGRFTYITTPQTIATTILLKMLKDTDETLGDKTCIVVDVSTGWNGYIPSLLDALRVVTVLDKIRGA
ncbi:MAG: TM1812 family CRISPR-associated protein [Candidatus Caldarchaeum sp.]